MVRPSLIPDYVPRVVTPNPDDACCWSMWRGYLEKEDGALVSKWFAGAMRSQSKRNPANSKIDRQSQ